MAEFSLKDTIKFRTLVQCIKFCISGYHTTHWGTVEKVNKKSIAVKMYDIAPTPEYDSMRQQFTFAIESVTEPILLKLVENKICGCIYPAISYYFTDTGDYTNVKYSASFNVLLCDMCANKTEACEMFGDCRDNFEMKVKRGG